MRLMLYHHDVDIDVVITPRFDSNCFEKKKNTDTTRH